MALKPGTYLGQYEVLALLGVGGMGEVYHARDSKLNREVALKVLPEQFARDPERIGRFRREAQVLASLDHPNIARIYAFEETGSARFLVMEYVPGETLRDKIREQGTGNREQSPDRKRGASPDRTAATEGPLAHGRGSDGGAAGIPLEEALNITRQIADGLEHAHEKPIIHRDLKPANVKVTPEGVVKILDFGLAKAFAGEAQGSDPTGRDSPTLSAMTAPGTILGTAAYMSPEQARGKKVDKRADIWALGCVLYELLTAKRAFDGEDIPEILAAVMKGEPDWTALPETTPPHVRFMLRRCLEKDPSRRFHAAGDVRLEIEEARSVAPAPAEPLPAAAPLPPPIPAWRRAVPVAVAILATAIVTGLAIWTLRTPPPQVVRRLAVTLPPDVALGNLNRPAAAISPDGNQIAFVGRRGGTEQLFLRALDSLETKPIQGTEGGTMPFFSPDGQWLGFFAGGNLKKTSLTGGAPVTVTALGTNQPGASWTADNAIVFGNFNSGLSQVSASGGTPQPLTKLDLAKGEFSHYWPQVLPGGKAVLFSIEGVEGMFNLDPARIEVQDVGTGERKILVQGGGYGRYLPSGHLAYVQSGTLMVAPFDLNRLEMTGPGVPVVEGIRQGSFFDGRGAQFSVSEQGSLIYISGSLRAAERNLLWVDRRGMEQPIAAPSRPYFFPRLSPDGQQVAVLIEGSIWIYHIPRGTLSRLTFEGSNGWLLWSPDGKRIAYNSARGGKASNLFWKPADGSGMEERLTTSEQPQFSHSFSPDGQLIAFVETNPSGDLDIWTLPVPGDPSASSGQARKPGLFFRTPFNERGPKFSPDGRWLAYSSDETSRLEIYVQPFPGPGGKVQISTDGGIEPLWARNGELFYRNGDRMMAVETRTQPTFTTGTPRLIFEGLYDQIGGGNTNYDVTADGQRFVMVKPAGQEAAAPTQIHVVLNWFEELKRRVPAPQ